MKFLTFALLISTTTALAQSDPVGTAILKPITTLFTGMNLGDSAMVHSAFADNATLASIGKDKTGKVIFKREASISGFLKAVGSPHKEPWSEPIWETEIDVDGDFAQVWTKYAFYIGKTFSHCGVDAFQLVKQNDQWKIFHLVDTRQKENCDLPKHVNDQFK